MVSTKTIVKSTLNVEGHPFQNAKFISRVGTMTLEGNIMMTSELPNLDPCNEDTPFSEATS